MGRTGVESGIRGWMPFDQLVFFLGLDEAGVGEGKALNHGTERARAQDLLAKGLDALGKIGGDDWRDVVVGHLLAFHQNRGLRGIFWRENIRNQKARQRERSGPGSESLSGAAAASPDNRPSSVRDSHSYCSPIRPPKAAKELFDSSRPWDATPPRSCRCADAKSCRGSQAKRIIQGIEGHVGEVIIGKEVIGASQVFAEDGPGRAFVIAGGVGRPEDRESGAFVMGVAQIA